MEISISAPQTLRLQAGSLVLEGITPTVQGRPATAWGGFWQLTGSGRIERQGALEPGGPVFGVRFERRETGRDWALRYWLEGFPLELDLDRFGLRIEAVSGLRAYLRSGYFSWDGSFYVEPGAMADFDPAEARPETGYALTQLLPETGSGNLVLGFQRHDRFQHTFTWDTRRSPLSLTIETLWDRKAPQAGQRIESEALLLLDRPGVEAALRAWAQEVAQAAPHPPRQPSPPITGWCSWYNLYAAVTEENIREHLAAAAETARQAGLPMRVFQIDDGFTPEMGDWLEVKPQFPNGMQPLLDEIRRQGFIPGLWIAPFMVGNRSHLYRDHPDWVVQDRETGSPLVQMRFYGEFRWHKRSEEYYILDVTHPEAFEYIRNVFHTWRWAWGCEYFKTDFMHFGSEHGPERAAWHTPGLTRIEIWRKLAEMIRQEIGEATWLGCGCPLWVPVGLVDGIRIGKDIGAEWNQGAESLLRDGATRNFGHGILWQADPDCILLRPRFHHLTGAEVEALALYAGMTGGMRMTSDHLGELPPERLALWKLILSWSGEPCQFPRLGQSRLVYEQLPADLESHRTRRLARAVDPLIVQVRPVEQPLAGWAVFFFNPSSRRLEQDFALADLGLKTPGRMAAWPELAVQVQAEPVIRLDLPPHHGKLIFLETGEILSAPPV